MSWRIRVLVAAVAALGFVPASVARAQPETDPEPIRASFDGEQLELSNDWGAATACIEVGGLVECFRSEAELRSAHPRVMQRSAARASSCSSSVRVYRSTGFSGGVLYLSTRRVVHNLSAYGFDNDMSSYRVGACSAAFYSGPGLGGSSYPGWTGAWASSSSMLVGWNNVVSSVYIY